MTRRIWRISILFLCLLAFSGCESGSESLLQPSSNGASATAPTQLGTVQFRNTLLRAIPGPVTELRVSGFDSNGNLLFGPETVAKAPLLEFQMPTATVRVQIDYLVQGQAIGTAEIPIAVRAGETTVIQDPDFLDTSRALSSLNPSTAQLSLAKGTSQPLQVTGLFRSGTQVDFTRLVIWTSSDPSRATVRADGTIQALNEGPTLITARFGTLSASTTVTVTPATVTSLALTPNPLSLALGTGHQLTATATFSDSSQQDVTSTAVWSSSAPTIATANLGLLQTLASGEAIISATFLGESASTNITVTPATLSRIDLTPRTFSLAKGTNQQLTATGVFTDLSTQDLTQSVSWSVDNTGIANVTGLGLLTGMSEGQAQVSGEFQGLIGHASVSVSPAVVTSLSVSPASPSLPKGTSAQLTATATFSDGTQQDVTSAASWSSSSTARATVSPSGLVLGQDLGSSQISASFSGQQGSAQVQVTAAVPVSLSLSPSLPSLALGTTQQFTATVTFSDNSTRDETANANWTSSQSAVASVTPGGLASSVAQGQTTISASFGGQSDSTDLTVTAAEIVSITLSPLNSNLDLGRSQQFTAIATLTDNSQQDVTSTVSWSSSMPNVATITPAGLANSVAIGQTAISAAVNGISSSTDLTVVNSVTIQSITVSPGQSLSTPGTTRQYTAIATLSDNSTQDVTSTASWSSSSSDVSVSSSGLASIATNATRNTNVTLTATLNSVSSTANLTVKQFAFVPTDTFGPEGIVVNADGSLFSQSSNAAVAGKLIAAHPNGRFFYSADSVNRQVQAHSYDEFGTLTPIGTALSTGVSPSALVIDSTRNLLFVANQGDMNTIFGSISAYRIQSDGSLVSAGEQSYNNNFIAQHLATNGRALYLFDSGTQELSVLAIATNGTLTQLDTEAFGNSTNTHQIAADPSGNYFFVSYFDFMANRLEMKTFSVAMDGSLTLARTETLANEPSSLVVNPTGTRLLFTDRGSDQLFSYSIGAGGVLSLLDSSPLTLAGDPTSTARTPIKVVLGAAGRFALVITIGDYQVTSFELAPNGSLSQVGAEALFAQPRDIAASP